MKFLNKNRVFTIEEFRNELSVRGTTGERAAESLLAYYEKTGRIIRIKRGLYVVIPVESDAENFVPDPFLLAAKMAPDAILVYHTALELHGKAQSVFSEFTYQTAKTFHIINYHGWKFRPVKAPVSLRRKKKADFGVLTVDRNGMDVRVSSLEQTLVDVLSRPVYSESWEEIWRSLESIEFFNLDRVIEYTKLLNVATTAAKVGFFLEQHKESLLVEDKYLQELQKLSPDDPVYMDSQHKAGKLVNRWNLIVPETVTQRSWEELA